MLLCGHLQYFILRQSVMTTNRTMNAMTSQNYGASLACVHGECISLFAAECYLLPHDSIGLFKSSLSSGFQDYGHKQPRQAVPPCALSPSLSLTRLSEMEAFPACYSLPEEKWTPFFLGERGEMADRAAEHKKHNTRPLPVGPSSKEIGTRSKSSQSAHKVEVHSLAPKPQSLTPA